MEIDDLIRLYGDGLRSMSHESYAELVKAAGCRGLAAQSSIGRDKTDPGQRVRNVICGKVLRYIERIESGEVREFNDDDLQLP